MSDDDIEFDVPDDDEVSPAPQDRARQKREAAQLRKQLKEAEALKAEVEELRSFKAEQEKVARQNAVSGVFQEMGLNPKWAGFYNGDTAEPEAVKAWATEMEFITPSEDAPPPAPASTGFTPTVITDSAPVGSKIYDADEFTALLATDPKKAEQVYRAGRLKKEEAPWGLQTRYHGRD